MQMNEKVLTALEVLKDCAENDFERHRIDALIKDLTDPPKVEQIDDKHQKFNGIVYRKNSEGYYSNNSGLHQYVWYYYTGIEIPNGYDIHHKDLCSTNNSIDNLQLLTRREHHQIHFSLKSSRFTKIFVCQNCGKEYIGQNTGRNKFCSDQCRNKFRNKNDRETRTCKYCGKKFSARKSSKTSHCSKLCSRQDSAKKNHKIIKCLWCGKEMEINISNKQHFCSHNCSINWQWANQKI
jgi:hypothetical protein